MIGAGDGFPRSSHLAPGRVDGAFHREMRGQRRVGDAKLIDFLTTLADCHKARSVSIYDRCKAVYEEL
jgi:hypothetical protein